MDNQNNKNFSEIINAAESGDSNAQNELGVLYLTGKGVNVDLAKAVNYFFLSANQGNPLALANLGRCSAEGLGVNKNIEHSMMLFSSCYLMGIDNVTSYIINEIKINELIELAEKGNSNAQYFLGLSYAEGVQVEKNAERAFYWFDKSAEQKNPLALQVYSRRLSNGIGCEKDLLHAEYILKMTSDLAEKQVGLIGRKKIESEIETLREKIIAEVPYILVKFITEEKFVDSFLDGNLFMKSLDQFAGTKQRGSSSNNDFRGDVLEGFSESFGHGYNPYFYKTDTEGNIEKDGMIGMVDVLQLKKKVFCLTAIEYAENQKVFVRPALRLKEFGKYAVIIKDVNEFLNRVRVAFNLLCKQDNAEYWMSYKRIKYDIDLSKQYKYSEYQKSKSYSWQNEFRISIDFTLGKFSSEILEDITDFAKLRFNGKIETDTNPLSIGKTYNFSIGNIRDICECISTDSLLEGKVSAGILEEKPQVITPYEMEIHQRPSFYRFMIPIQNKQGDYQIIASDKILDSYSFKK